MNVDIQNRWQSYRVYQLPGFGWKKFELNRRMLPDSAIFFILFYQYDFVVGLLQGFMINTHESGSNSPGAGTFTRDLTKTKPLQCRDFTWALHIWKSQYPRYSQTLGGTWLQKTGALQGGQIF